MAMYGRSGSVCCMAMYGRSEGRLVGHGARLAAFPKRRFKMYTDCDTCVTGRGKKQRPERPEMIPDDCYVLPLFALQIISFYRYTRLVFHINGSRRGR